MEPKSLEVPLVQEISKQGLTEVPERYVRPIHERPIQSTTANNCNNGPLPQLPVIDFSNLLSQHLKESELQKLHSACKHWGFFQLINHGVSDSLLESVKKGAQEFFNLPLEEKNRFRQRDGDVQGYGQLFVVSEEQKLNWGDVFFMFTEPPHNRKPHLFPNLPLPFRDDLDNYSAQVKDLAVQVIHLIANALKIDPKEMSVSFGEGAQLLRMNYYPPCPQPELVLGIHPHSDGGGLTILLQANQVQGLQIKKDGLWIPLKPLPNAFIINIGNIMEMITNGIYESIEHRAIVNAEKERLSIATFYLPSMESRIGPAPSLVTPETPELFRRIRFSEYYKGYMSKEIRGKEFLYSLKIQNESDKSS